MELVFIKKELKTSEKRFRPDTWKFVLVYTYSPPFNYDSDLLISSTHSSEEGIQSFDDQFSRKMSIYSFALEVWAILRFFLIHFIGS